MLALALTLFTIDSGKPDMIVIGHFSSETPNENEKSTHSTRIPGCISVRYAIPEPVYANEIWLRPSLITHELPVFLFNRTLSK